MNEFITMETVEISQGKQPVEWPFCFTSRSNAEGNSGLLTLWVTVSKAEDVSLSLKYFKKASPFWTAGSPSRRCYSGHLLS